MDNIYDIRKEKQLQFILPTECSSIIPGHEQLQAVAVVVNLYYTEKVEYYSTYLNCLPEGIDLYIFSSNEETLRKAKRFLSHKNIIFSKKENRGRDLSTFLVAFQPYVDKYRLICFVHDKKEHEPWMKADTDKWNENLWGNMIATTDYVYNVLQLFERQPRLGMLFPPEPLGEHKTSWYKASWSENFDNCLKLAEKMQLSANISMSKPPIALGSVFWTRKEALLKLLHMHWRYEDFPREPMPVDFTISHAIERILGYVAQDAGYDVATIMTEQYASWSLLFLQDYFRQMFFELSNRMGIENLRQFYVLTCQKERILKYFKTHKAVFLYGAGKYGKALLKVLREEKIEPAGFIVTNFYNDQDLVEGVKVYRLGDLDLKEAGIILTVYYPLQKEMIHTLRVHGISDFLILFNGFEYNGKI